jgi:hypothetical protein
MRELVAKAFGVDPDHPVRKNILVSLDPGHTIGSGLALYLGLRERHRDRVITLVEACPRARERLSNAITKRLDVFADETAKLVLSSIMPAIEAPIWSWYKNGGSLAALEARIDGICKQKEGETQALIRRECENLFVDIRKFVKDHLVALLRENQINKDITKYLPDINPTTRGPVTGGAIIDQIVKAFGELAETISGVTSGVIGGVIIVVNHSVLIGLALVHLLRLLWWRWGRLEHG